MKKIIVPLIALTVSVVLNAFSTPFGLKKGTTCYFYIYVGAQNVPSREDPSNYVLSSTPTTDPDCTGVNECAVEICFTTNTEPTALSAAQKLIFDDNGFPTGQGSGAVGVFVKNEKKP